MQHILTSWSDYWVLFDNLVNLMLEEKQEEVAHELKDVQKYVNGMTDGWYDFKSGFEKVIMSNKANLTKVQLDLADFLLTSLNTSLQHR